LGIRARARTGRPPYPSETVRAVHHGKLVRRIQGIIFGAVNPAPKECWRKSPAALTAISMCCSSKKLRAPRRFLKSVGSRGYFFP
jgi:hypothetical protein